jgi:hypothetical protein
MTPFSYHTAPNLLANRVDRWVTRWYDDHPDGTLDQLQADLTRCAEHTKGDWRSLAFFYPADWPTRTLALECSA